MCGFNTSGVFACGCEMDASWIAAEAKGHEFRATELVPGWCVRCGGAKFVHEHPAWTCRPETCGGVDYDPCSLATGDGEG